MLNKKKQNGKLNIQFDLSYIKRLLKNSLGEMHQHVNSDCL